jgi:hypothetical protein
VEAHRAGGDGQTEAAAAALPVKGVGNAGERLEQAFQLVLYGCHEKRCELS